MLTTLTRPDAGSATVAGRDALRHPDRVRAVIGTVSQRSSADPDWGLVAGRLSLLAALAVTAVALSTRTFRAYQKAV